MKVSRDKPIWALGLMSGTSMDGVDAALVLTDGETISEFGTGAERPFAVGEVSFLPTIMQNWSDYRPPAGPAYEVELTEAEAEIDGAHAAAIGHLLSLTPVSPEVVGYHAQTIYHAPDCLLYTSPSPRDRQKSRMPYSA